MADLVLKNIVKQYRNVTGKVRAVDGITLSVDDGEFMVIVGPSGCGKTTTLRLIAGLERPDHGTITINGNDVTKVPARKRNVAMVFQNYALYPHMTVRQNMAFALKMRKTPRKDINQRIDYIAALLGIEHLLSIKPGLLSGGQRQSAALAKALVRNANILLLDEPLSNLDAQLRNCYRNILMQLHKKLHLTVVYVTHDQDEAIMLANNICVLNCGAVQQIGTPDDIRTRPASDFVADFFGIARTRSR